MIPPARQDFARRGGRLLAVIALCTVYGADATAAARRMPAAETPRCRIYVVDEALSGRQLDRMAASCQRACERVLAFVGHPQAPTRITYRVYPSCESKGLATRNTHPAHIDMARNTVHLVSNAHIRGDDARPDAVILLRRHLGRPATELLEMGLSVYFSTNWRSQGYEYWAARLYRSGNAPALAELLDNESFRRESYLVAEPLAATFVAYLMSAFGEETLRNRYVSWRAVPGEIAELERGWHTYLDQLVRRYHRQITRDRREIPRLRGFQKGFCHAHEGYQIFNGYLSRKSDEALQRLAEIGANAVSITPFTYMRSPQQPAPLPFSNGAGSENDEGIIHAAAVAHRLGMSVMLKPHIWLHRSWPGEIEMPDSASVKAFFDYYYRWMRHYALLSEMRHIDILCIGVEMSRMTVGHDAEWRSLIHRLSALYSGAITYAANWGDEFEQVGFWDDLDYIGINCYYPLSDRDDASTEDLRRGAENVLQRIKVVHARFDKPVLLTEIGFTSTVAPWKQPHERGRQKPAYFDDQAQCYEAVFEALYGEKWCEGIYWWKWPSFLEYGGKDNPGFTPNNKPAENVVRKWYARTW